MLRGHNYGYLRVQEYDFNLLYLLSKCTMLIPPFSTHSLTCWRESTHKKAKIIFYLQVTVFGHRYIILRLVIHNL